MTRIIVRNQDLSSSGALAGYAFVAANILLFGIRSFLGGYGIPHRSAAETKPTRGSVASAPGTDASTPSDASLRWRQPPPLLL
jgi:hypothetical protein